WGRTRRREEHSGTAAHPGSRAARRTRGLWPLLRVGGRGPVLAVRGDAGAGPDDHAPGDRPRGPGRRRARDRADGPGVEAPIPRHRRAARVATRTAAALLLQRGRLVHRARLDAVPPAA